MSSDTTGPVAIDLDTFIASHQKKLSKTAQLVRHLDEIARLEAAGIKQREVIEYLTTKLGFTVYRSAIRAAQKAAMKPSVADRMEAAEAMLSRAERAMALKNRKDALLALVSGTATDSLPPVSSASVPAAVRTSRSPGSPQTKVPPENHATQSVSATKPKMSKEEASRRLDAYIKAESSKIGDYIPRKSTSVVPMPKITETEYQENIETP